MNKKKGKAKLKLDAEKFGRMLEQNTQGIIDAVFGEAVHLAIKAKHGGGQNLPGLEHAHMSNEANEARRAEQVEEISRAMHPLTASLKILATQSFIAIFSGMLGEPQFREYLLRRSSSLVGKGLGGRRGGRPPGKKAQYLDWLETVLLIQENEHRDDIPPFTAKEHFRALIHRTEILEKNTNGELVFVDSVLDKWCLGSKEEPVITLSAVSETLTRIRKT